MKLSEKGNLFDGLRHLKCDKGPNKTQVFVKGHKSKGLGTADLILNNALYFIGSSHVPNVFI